MMEFHISRAARNHYQFDLLLYATSGNVIFANMRAVRLFAQKMNAHRDLARYPEQTIRSGQLNAMALIDEILHFVIHKYRQQTDPRIMEAALTWLEEQVGKPRLDKALEMFNHEFPSLVVYLGQSSSQEYLDGQTLLLGEWVSNRSIVLEEMLTIWLANENPAFASFHELFDDAGLARNSAYIQIIDSLRDFFDQQPPFGPDSQNLIEMLRSPALAVPFSLSGQLEYIRSRWGFLLEDLILRLLVSLDFIKEEDRVIFSGPGPATVYTFDGLEQELERFSADRDWMPNLVLIAKNTHVWLDQLSKKYQRPIYRLDQIPEEELDLLAHWGFSGLWLIGLWERSPASRRIKQMRGNPEAEASAYSLFEYTIAGNLGGEEAYRTLRKQAWQRGIRMASDMVPNHMGIDSRWVIEHPEWFISLDSSPYPSYTFNGENLSWDSRVGIYLEDHYYDNSDAAVVFKRVDFWSGQEKYLYHGNDGTSMPWNDTAQLNYLLPEVREAVTQTILKVARQFPIIRFDAAMTLAKRHYQRLWFPEPGSGGDIPSRAEHSMTREQFNAVFPVEFWREVVDRVAQEAPDTLLLAEAFWLMEGYFVRTLGMHRVYNSAFMNMLRDEKNLEYRLVIKNTLEFDPEILKRYVNFMNNPDERTAVDQFGKGDKYFGIGTLLATLPGLPMFGHGQVEGFTEKYGMEYRRAYLDEQADPQFVDRHEREIFPLLRKRYLFAGVANFLLYDFIDSGGNVNEDVFAYTNRVGGERSLVIYHNKYAKAEGRIHTSAAYLVKESDGEQRRLVQRNLGEGLGLHHDADHFTILRDQITGLEYIRSNQDIYQHGLYIELFAYQAHVFTEIREVQDTSQHEYARVAAQLNGKGIYSIEQARKEISLQPVQSAFKELVNSGQIQWLITQRTQTDQMPGVIGEVNEKLVFLLGKIKGYQPSQEDEHLLAAAICQDIERFLQFSARVAGQCKNARGKEAKAFAYLSSALSNYGEDALNTGHPVFYGVVLSWMISRRLGSMHPDAQEDDAAKISRFLLKDWRLDETISHLLVDLGAEVTTAWRYARMVKLLVTHDQWADQFRDAKGELDAFDLMESWLQDVEVRQFLGVNFYEGIEWFNKELLEEWLGWMIWAALLEKPASKKRLQEAYQAIQQILKAESESGFQVDRLLENLKVIQEDLAASQTTAQA